MSNPMEKTLYRTAALIFEEMAFLLPTPVDGSIGSVPSLMASVNYRGPFGGRVLVRVTKDVLPLIACNMLGLDEAPAESMERDALGEIANVICGNVLPAIGGSDEVFHLDAPLFFESATPEEPVRPEEVKAVVHIGLDPGRADITFCVKS
jgi:CheY-specific phosphatase CheX